MPIDLLENCSLCYRFTLSEFPASIQIIGGLEPNTPYYIWFTDKFDRTLSTNQLTTDADGNITITGPEIANFPAAWFNKDAGIFTIEAKPVAPYYALTSDFTFGGKTYECIAVDFQVNNAPKTVIV